MANFTDNFIDAVWRKAIMVSGYDPEKWRKDYAGAWICRTQYGLTSLYGWEIDHLRPISMSGNDSLGNLYPLHWRNNRSKGDSYPSFITVLSSEGNQNIDRTQSWKARQN